MPFTGSTTPNTGTTSAADLSRDVHIGVVEAFKRQPMTIDFLESQTISGGTGGQFIIEGKEDDADTNVAGHVSGTQVNVTASTQDEIVINLDRPQYVARRIDDWDAAIANYDVMAMNTRQVGSKMINVVDRKAVAAVEAATTATGLVNNGSGTVVVNTSLPGGAAAGATAKLLGDAIAESIFAGVASIRASDDFGDVFVNLGPVNYSYLVQSDRCVNADFTNGNGGFDTGEVKRVGSAYILQTNNMPATAGLVALMFTSQAAGVVKLWDLQTKVIDDPDFLSAKRLQAYFSNGMAPLRPQSAAALKNV